jgi:TatD DNase family protein
LPHRGKQNRPSWVPLVGEAVAGAKGVPVAEVEAASTATAERIFGFGPG